MPRKNQCTKIWKIKKAKANANANANANEITMRKN
jgi:hypothetical protein